MFFAEQDAQLAASASAMTEGRKNGAAGPKLNPLSSVTGFRSVYSNHAEMKGISRMCDAVSSLQANSTKCVIGLK